MIPPVVASDRGRAQTVCVATRMRGSRTETLHARGEEDRLESRAAEGESPVSEAPWRHIGILSSAGHEESCVNRPGPSGKAKYSLETDSEPVP